MVPGRFVKREPARRWLRSVRRLLRPSETYCKAEYSEHRSTSILMTLVIAAVSASSWWWDYALDPVGARATIWLRLAVFPTVAPYLAALLFRCHRKWAILAAALAFVGWEVDFFEILERLQGGMVYGLAGFMYFVAMPLLMTRGFTFATNALFSIALVLFPLVLAASHADLKFPVAQYAALTFPAALMSVCGAWAFSQAYAALWRSRRRWKHVASTDALTGLPNRRRFVQLLQERALRGERVGLLAIDLDRFKEVNDTLGHRGGDDLLRQVAARLRRCIRPADVPARLGGDEFAVILGDSIRERDVIEVAERILKVLEHSFRIEGRDVLISCSIGIALDVTELQDPDQLYERADAAMYQVKEEGRRGFRVSETTSQIKTYALPSRMASNRKAAP